MCRVLKLQRSGYYAWLKKPVSDREKEDSRLLKKIKDSWEDSDYIYGSIRIFEDLRESGETCGLNRVSKIMRRNNIYGLSGYKKRKFKYGKPSKVYPNLVKQDFNVTEPNKVWVIDITYIRTYEGWLYLSVVIDLCSRRVVGWSMSSRMDKSIVIQSLLIAQWKRKPEGKVIIHSDQGSQFSSDEWNRFCRDHNFEPSMSRRGNCFDNAAAESFFSSLKKEKIRKKIYKKRDAARRDIFEYIEFFYNKKRRHKYIGNISPIDFEKKIS